jgi:hypothetical protein
MRRFLVRHFPKTWMFPNYERAFRPVVLIGLLTVSVGCASRLSRVSGASVEDWGKAEQREADEAAAGWRAAGTAGLTSAAQAFCGPMQTQAMRKAAEATLKAGGLEALSGLAACMPGSGKPRPSLEWHVVTLSAQILCAAPSAEQARLASSVRGLPRSPRPKANTFAQSVLLTAIEAEHAREPFPCPAKDELARLLVTDVLPPEQLARLVEDRRRTVLRALSRVGPAGAPYVPTLIGWLGREQENAWTHATIAESLASMGAAASSATEALLVAVDRYAAGPRPTREERDAIIPLVDVLPKLVDALSVVAAPSARIASRLEGLVQLSSKASGLPNGPLWVAVVRAVARLSADGDTTAIAKVVPKLEVLLRYRVTGEGPFRLEPLAPECIPYHGDACPPPLKPLPRGWPDAEPFPRRHTYLLMGMTWQMLVEATGGLGEPARPLAPWLSRLMIDKEVDLGLRIACARALQGLGGKRDHEALKSLLIARGQALAQLPIRLDRRQYTQPTNQRRRESPAYAAEAFRLCLGEQALEPQVIEAELMNLGDLANQRFDSCLNRRLCGPGPSDRAAVLRTCCDYAYVGRQPSLCRAAQ